MQNDEQETTETVKLEDVPPQPETFHEESNPDGELRDEEGRFLRGYTPGQIEDVGRKGWWEIEDGVQKLAKLELAFSYGATNIEACAFAEISESNLYYYQKINAEFKSRKKELKSKVLFTARKNIVDRIRFENAEDKDDVTKLNMPANNSWQYMKSHSDEFADKIDPDMGKKLGNTLAIVDFREDDEEELAEDAEEENYDTEV